jgi:transcriptional regulator with AAA-type ATPase domain
MNEYMRYLMYYKNGIIKKFPLKKAVIRIGRSSANDIALDDTEVSKKHCKIEVFDNYIRVIDLNSRNGTFVEQSPVKQADITLNQSFGIGHTEFYLKAGDLKEFKISAELSDIFSISTGIKRKTDMMELETEESTTKYDRLLQNILEKAITCDDRTAFVNGIQADLSSIIVKGSLFFNNDGEWFTLLDQLQLTQLQSIKQLLKGRTGKQGNLIHRGTTLYYHVFESTARQKENFLLYFSNQKPPVSTTIFNTFLNRLIEIIEFHLKIIPGVSFKLDFEPILYHDKEISIIGSSPSMKKTVEFARRIAPKPTFIMIMGESGTGKELIAKMIHHLSGRKKYIALNCAAIPANLLESELFGYESGAFTDARKRKKGKIEEASGGTLVFDEIGDMPLEIQAKLLRVIQEKAVTRLGGMEEINVDIRVISMTNQDLYQQVEEKKFRQDLFFRLRVHQLVIPPLRERQEDIPGLIKHFAGIYAEKNQVIHGGFSESAREIFLNYDWPGNARELENEIARIMEIIEDHEMISDHHILSSITASCKNKKIKTTVTDSPAVREKSFNPERERILKLLEQNKGNKAKTARDLGMSYRGFLKKVKRLQIS